jgi:hypothetical protein
MFSKQYPEKNPIRIKTWILKCHVKNLFCNFLPTDAGGRFDFYDYLLHISSLMIKISVVYDFNKNFINDNCRSNSLNCEPTICHN